jgi:hypothetical protein
MHEFSELSRFIIPERDHELDRPAGHLDLDQTRTIKIPIVNPSLSLEARERILAKYMQKRQATSQEFIRHTIPSQN